MKKLRVVNVITRLAEGSGLVALKAATGLDPERYEVSFVTGATGPDDVRLDTVRRGTEALKHAGKRDLIGRAFDAGHQVMQVPALVPGISPIKDHAALRVLTRLLEEGEYDIVHTHSAKAGAVGRLAGAKVGVDRIVHTWHGFPFYPYQAAWRRRTYIAIEKYLGRHTDAFLAVSSQVAVEALERGLGDAERIRVIGPALDDDVVYPVGNAARAQARARLGLPPGVRVMGSVGRVVMDKGPDMFIQVLSDMPEDTYGLWVGDGPAMGKMRVLAERLGVTDRLMWLGYRKDVPEVLPAFDVFVLPSHYEGLPVVILEAMQAGIPIVASAVNGIPDVIVPGTTGLLVMPMQRSQWTAAVTFLLNYPREGQRMADTARATMLSRFSAQALSQTVDGTYRGASRRPARKPSGGLTEDQISEARAARAA